MGKKEKTMIKALALDLRKLQEEEKIIKQQIEERKEKLLDFMRKENVGELTLKDAGFSVKRVHRETVAYPAAEVADILGVKFFDVIKIETAKVDKLAKTFPALESLREIKAVSEYLKVAAIRQAGRND